ncbi:hypothetical protein Dimus_024545 [Dionaea muscipula]
MGKKSGKWVCPDIVSGLSAEYSYSSTDEDVCSLQTIDEEDDEDALDVSSNPSEDDLREELEQVHNSQGNCSTSAQNHECSPNLHETLAISSEIPLGSPSRTPLKLPSPMALQFKAGKTISDELRAPSTTNHEISTSMPSKPPLSDPIADNTGNPNFKGQWSKLFSDNRRPVDDFLMKKVEKHQNTNCRRASSTKKAWVPKVPMPVKNQDDSYVQMESTEIDSRIGEIRVQPGPTLSPQIPHVTLGEQSQPRHADETGCSEQDEPLFSVDDDNPTTEGQNLTDHDLLPKSCTSQNVDTKGYQMVRRRGKAPPPSTTTLLTSSGPTGHSSTSSSGHAELKPLWADQLPPPSLAIAEHRLLRQTQPPPSKASLLPSSGIAGHSSIPSPGHPKLRPHRAQLPPPSSSHIGHRPPDATIRFPYVGHNYIRGRPPLLVGHRPCILTIGV